MLSREPVDYWRRQGRFRYYSSKIPSRVQCSAIGDEQVARALAEGVAIEDRGVSIGWRSVMVMIEVYLRQVIELGGVLIGLGWSLLPSAFGAGVLMEAVGKGELDKLFQLLRFSFSFALIGSGLTMMVMFIFVVLEVLILSGLAIGCIPLAACLAVWQRTRSAVRQILGALLYLVVTLLYAGIAAEVAYMALELSVHLFVSSVIDPRYVEASGGVVCFNRVLHEEGEVVCKVLHEKVVRFGGCGVPGASLTVQDGVLSLRGNGLGDSFSAYLCLLGMEQIDIEEGGKSVPILATTIETSLTGWLPHVLVLVGGTVIVSMIMKYVSSAAAEFSGFKGSTSQVVQQIVGGAKGVLSTGAKKLSKYG